MSTKRLVFGFVVATVAAFAACGGGKNTFGNPDGGDDATGGDALVDVNLTFPETSVSDAPAQTHCSGRPPQRPRRQRTKSSRRARPIKDAARADACRRVRARADNKSTIGCDYYAVDPDAICRAQGWCFAAYIANTWDVAGHDHRRVRRQPLEHGEFARIPSGNGQRITYAPLTNGQLPPNQVAILFLSQTARQPGHRVPAGITPGFTTADAAAHGTGSATRSTSRRPRPSSRTTSIRTAAASSP